MTAPVRVVADIGHTGHRLQTGRFHPPEEFLPHRSEIDQMVGSAQILLRNLELHHHRRLLQRGKQRAIGLARLEVHGAVLDLDNDVVDKLPVQRHELLTGLIRTVAALRLIYEGAPHHDALMRFQNLTQHVGTVGMCPSKVLRPWFTLGVGFYEESAEVGNHLIDLVHLALPPANDLGIEWVGSLQPAHLDG